MGVIPDVVPQNQRGVASGYMALLSQLGNLAGAFVGGLAIINSRDWLPYTACATALVGVGAITLLGMKETPLPLPRVNIHWPSYLKSLWISPREHPDFAWVWITRALVMLGFYAFLPFINYYLIDVIGIPRERVGEEAPKLLAIILLFACFSSIYGGKLSDRIGRKKVVYVANGGIAVVALGFIFCRDMTQAMIVGSIFGFFYGAYGSVDYALGTDVLPNKAHAGKDMAVWHIAMTLPQSFASPIAGALIASFGYQQFVENGETVVRYTANGYSSVFILCSISFGIGAFLLRNVRGVD
jgi:MFS family permease